MNSLLRLGSHRQVLKLAPSRQVRDEEQALRRVTAATGLAAIRCLRAFNTAGTGSSQADRVTTLL